MATPAEELINAVNSDDAARVEQEMYDSVVHDWERERYLERG